MAEKDGKGPTAYLEQYFNCLSDADVKKFLNEYSQIRLQIFLHLVQFAVAGSAACRAFGVGASSLSGQDREIAEGYAALIQDKPSAVALADKIRTATKTAFDTTLREPTLIVAEELDKRRTIRGGELQALWLSLAEKRLVRLSPINRPDKDVLAWALWYNRQRKEAAA